ncbi:hypothetical protein B8W67_18005 [Mycolicibacillus koreensis]|uniref:Uncharacterized protein n=2 Tax=Mycolicibacillus koreensis TaxID=1069220 RepID=A0AA91SQ67_9MYCO|nr:hypothetical protein B8W67_18005 [Mycolicibacillus koreensis]
MVDFRRVLVARTVACERALMARMTVSRRPLFAALRRIAERVGPLPLPAARGEFAAAQLEILRELAIAWHDDGKALLVALAPLFDEAAMKDVWLELRRSGPNLMKTEAVRRARPAAVRPELRVVAAVRR